MGTVRSQDIELGGQTVAQSQTDEAISQILPLPVGAWIHGFRVAVKVGAATEAVGIDFRVQQSPNAEESSPTWTDVDGTNAKLDPDGDDNQWYSIPISPWNDNFDEDWPLERHIRVVCTTGAGDSIVIDTVRITYPEL